MYVQERIQEKQNFGRMLTQLMGLTKSRGIK